jgi:hypothetical protein
MGHLVRAEDLLPAVGFDRLERPPGEVDQAGERLSVRIRDLGGVVALKQRRPERPREEREAVGHVGADLLFRIALGQEQLGQLSVRIGVHVDRDGRNPGVREVEFP